LAGLSGPATAKKRPVKTRLPLIILAVLLVAFRLLGAAFPNHLPNFQPLPALLLCSLVFLDGRVRWILPAGVWLLSDPLVSVIQGYPVAGWHHLALVPGLAATIGLACWLRQRPGTMRLVAGSAVAAVVFYLLTNALSFVALPLYPKTLEGFVQAQWTGPAGFAPTWLFLRNALLSNLAFTGLVLAAGCRVPVPVPARKAAGQSA
jgi:hypothetical protein